MAFASCLFERIDDPMAMAVPIISENRQQRLFPHHIIESNLIFTGKGYIQLKGKGEAFNDHEVHNQCFKG